MPSPRKAKSSFKGNEIAVIGMAGKFPGAENIGEYWENLKNGVESVATFSNEELERAGIPKDLISNPSYVKAKGVIKYYDQFDADFFSYPPREAERMDPQIRMLHECAWEAFEDAGYDPESFHGLIGAYLGANDNSDWIRRISGPSANFSDNIDQFLLNYRDYSSTRISYKLNLHGPSFTLLSACSTSLVAIHLACQALRDGDCELALAGGTSIMFPEISGYIYQEGLMLSSDGHCRAFDAKADGTVFGDGVGVVVLKTLKNAIEDRDSIHAVIRGSAINNDGNGKLGFTAPSIEGQRKVIEAAHRASNVKPEEISYVETHGTGTLSGDPVEFEALRRAFKTTKRNYCGIGSVKTNIGHVNVAAGVSALIKTILAMEHRQLPPSLHFKKPNPAMNIAESPFYVNDKLKEWKSNGKPRRAGISAFGFGGTNSHIVIEEAPKQVSSGTAKSPCLLTLSAKTESALSASARNLSHYLKNEPSIELGNVAYTLASGRKHFEFRRSVVATDVPEAISELEKLKNPIHADKRNTSAIFMFPGQGSQYVGMGKELYANEPVFKEYIDRSAKYLKKELKRDIRDFIAPRKTRKKNATAESITQTEFAQPIIFAYSYALAMLLMEWGIRPSALIGHSMGEIVAASVAEVITLEDGLHLVAQRGKLMQQLPHGSMLAVPLSENEVSPYLNDDISLAAVNASSLCVLSGDPAAIKSLKMKLRKEGIPGQYLATSHAFHSRMMDPVLDDFRKVGSHIKYLPPKIPILSTVTGDWVKDSEINGSGYWTRNVRQTVRFSDGVRKLMLEREGVFVEVGPGKALSNLAKMNVMAKKSRTIVATSAGAGESRSELAVLLTAVGEIWSSGLPVNWEKYYGNQKRSRVPLPTYPFERRRFGIASKGLVPGHTNSWAQLTKKPNIADWFYIPSWKKTPSPYIQTNGKWERNCWLILIDDCGVGISIKETLESNGQDVIVARPGAQFSEISESEFLINAALHDDYEELFSRLDKLNKFPQRIIHLWTITPNSQLQIDWETAEAYQDRCFFSLLFISQVIGNQNVAHDVHIAVVSNNLHDALGSEDIIPDKATILGPIKVIPQEYPGIRCCNIDVQLPESEESFSPLIDQILTEAITNSLEPVVAYRGENKWVQTFDRARLEENLRQRAWIKDRGTYLITGGLGGLGLVIAEFLAKEVKANLILTGRSELPAREQWEEWLRSHEKGDPVSEKIRKLQRFEKLGSQIHLIIADVTDRDRMAAGIAEGVNRFGNINGVIHAAGVHGEGIIQLKKDIVAKRILAPKIKGTIILDDILKDVQPDFVLLCSSIASFLGGIGLVDYCAANAYMDAFVTQRRFRNKKNVLSVNWDMWGEVGMGLKTQMPDELKEWLVKELRDGITSAEGIDVLQRILTWRKSRNVIVSTRDLQARIDLWIKREFIKEKESLLDDEGTMPKYMRPNLSTDFIPPETETEKAISVILGKLFGIEKVGRQDNFYELGGHSLLATTLVSKLKREFNTNLSIRDILDHPVLAELSEFIDTSRLKNRSSKNKG